MAEMDQKPARSDPVTPNWGNRNTIAVPVSAAAHAQIAALELAARRKKIDSQLREAGEKISAIENPEQKRKALLLWDLLPTGLEESSGTSPAGIPPFSKFRHLNHEELFVLRHPELDPELARWVDKAREVTALENDLPSKIRALTVLAHTSLYSHKNILIRGTFNRLQRHGKPALLGDFLKIRSGSCRHFDAVTQIGMQEIPAESRMMHGYLLDVPLRGTPKKDHDMHAWNETDLDAIPHIVDSSNGGKVAPITLINELLDRSDARAVKAKISSVTACKNPDKLDAARCFFLDRSKDIVEVYVPMLSEPVSFEPLTRADIKRLILAF